MEEEGASRLDGRGRHRPVSGEHAASLQPHTGHAHPTPMPALSALIMRVRFEGQ